jgi:hypothetical protein
VLRLRGIDARQRLVAPQERQRLEDPRRNRGSRERDAHGLEDVARLRAARGDDVAQRRFDVLGVERLDRDQRRARIGERRAPVLAEPALARRGVVGGSVEDEARQRPEVCERLQLVGADRGGVE